MISVYWNMPEMKLANQRTRWTISGSAGKSKEKSKGKGKSKEGSGDYSGEIEGSGSGSSEGSRGGKWGKGKGKGHGGNFAAWLVAGLASWQGMGGMGGMGGHGMGGGFGGGCEMKMSKYCTVLTHGTLLEGKSTALYHSLEWVCAYLTIGRPLSKTWRKSLTHLTLSTGFSQFIVCKMLFSSTYELVRAICPETCNACQHGKHSS